MTEARPEEGLCYFTVESDGRFAACVSVGIHYKRVHALQEGFATEAEAQACCVSHYSQPYAGGIHDEESAPIILSEDQAQVILGALDTVATALTGHGHTWTDGERTIYEYAVGLLPHFCWSCCARFPMGCTDATCADCKHSLAPPPE